MQVHFSGVFFKVKFVFQGESGRDGLSLPGPPGPPGLPGPITNLQDVSGDFILNWEFLHFTLTLFPFHLPVQLLLNGTDSALNFSGIFEAQGPVVSIRTKTSDTHTFRNSDVNTVFQLILQDMEEREQREIH